MTKPKISVALICYNQEKFIAAAIEGALNQKHDDFDLEIVIGNDCSTDGTSEIIEKYASENQETIRLLPISSNLGMHRNWKKTIEACTGEFVAILEGDDCWDDPSKLEKQLNLLAGDQNASACFSNAKVIQSDGGYSAYNYVDSKVGNLDAHTFFQLNYNPIPTCTVLFRKAMLSNFPEPYFRSPFADWIVHSLLMQQGHYIYLNECTSSYRQHDGGVWSGVKKEKQLLNKLKAIQLISTIVSSEYMQEVKTAYRKQLDQLLYFYRDEKRYWNYFSTWLKLKFH